MLKDFLSVVATKVKVQYPLLFNLKCSTANNSLGQMSSDIWRKLGGKSLRCSKGSVC